METTLPRSPSVAPRVEGDRRVRVLHLLPWVTSGGVERRRLSLARRLDPDRFEQRILTTVARDPLRAELVAAGVPVDVVAVPSSWAPWDVRGLREVVTAIRRHRPHIVHGAVFEGIVAAGLGGTLARVAGADPSPIIIGEETGVGKKDRSWRGDAILRLALAPASRVVAVSPSVEQDLVGRLGISPERTRLVMNGVEDWQEPAVEDVEAVRQELGLERHHVVCGSVGRVFDGHKRFSDLIDAAALLREAHPEFRLLIVGDGPDLEGLRARAVDRGVGERVVFAGYRGDTRVLYRLMDMFALASRHESFGLVLVEAMFAGLPTVATRVGGIPTIVMDGDTGFLVPVGQPGSLASAMRRLVTQPELRVGLGEAGRRRAYERFSADRYARDVAALYDEVMESPS